LIASLNPVYLRSEAIGTNSDMNFKKDIATQTLRFNPTWSYVSLRMAYKEEIPLLIADVESVMLENFIILKHSRRL